VGAVQRSFWARRCVWESPFGLVLRARERVLGDTRRLQEQVIVAILALAKKPGPPPNYLGATMCSSVEQHSSLLLSPRDLKPRFITVPDCLTSSSHLPFCAHYTPELLPLLLLRAGLAGTSLLRSYISDTVAPAFSSFRAATLRLLLIHQRLRGCEYDPVVVPGLPIPQITTFEIEACTCSDSRAIADRPATLAAHLRLQHYVSEYSTPLHATTAATLRGAGDLLARPRCAAELAGGLRGRIATSR